MMEVRQWDINCKINLINIKLFSKPLEFNDKDACWREYSTSYQTRSIYSYPLPDTVHVSRNARGRKQMNICRSYVIRSAHVFFHHPDINPSGGDQLTSTGILGRPLQNRMTFSATGTTTTDDTNFEVHRLRILTGMNFELEPSAWTRFVYIGMNLEAGRVESL